MPDTEDAPDPRAITGQHTVSTFYRRPPGAAWLLALVVVPLLLALVGWAGLKKPDAGADLSSPSVTPSATVSAPAPGAPARALSPLSIERNGRNFTLSGDLPDVAMKNSLMDSFKMAFGPGITFTDKINIKAGANPPDFAALGSIMGSSAGINNFRFDLSAGTVTLDGTAPSDKVKADAEDAARTAWPNMKVVNNITVSTATPAPAPRPAPTPAAGPGGSCATLQADLTAVLKTPITFSTNGFSLTPALRRQLSAIAEKLTACPDPKVSVVGHTDSSGNDAINIPLSNDRAKAVADYLVSQGVAADRLTSKGVGSAQPIAADNTPAGKAQNRRVDITVS